MGDKKHVNITTYIERLYLFEQYIQFVTLDVRADNNSTYPNFYLKTNWNVEYDFEYKIEFPISRTVLENISFDATFLANCPCPTF